MIYHQTNAVEEMMKEKLESIHESNNIPWKATCNTHLGRSLETRERILMDELKTATGQRRNEISVELSILSNLLCNVKYKQHGWYCFYCGWLLAEQVTNDECCNNCGAVLPK